MPTPPPPKTTIRLGHFAFALFAQTAWGLYAGLTRYLQDRSNIGAFTILATASWVVIIFVLTPYLIRSADGLRQVVFMQKWWWYCTLVLLRSITNILSTRFTLSIYVQMINLTTPIFVSLLNRVVWPTEGELPRYTVLTLIVSLFGSVLAFTGKYLDSSHSGSALTADDAIGISLAVVSTLFLAGYFLFIRSIDLACSKEGVLWVQMMCIAVVCTPAAFVFDDRIDETASDLNASDWLVLGAFVAIVWLGANVGQIFTIRLLGAPLVSCLLPWRLVPALIFGTVVLNERLNALQLVGCITVMLSVGSYLSYHYYYTSNGASQSRKQLQQLQELHGASISSTEEADDAVL